MVNARFGMPPAFFRSSATATALVVAPMELQVFPFTITAPLASVVSICKAARLASCVRKSESMIITPA